MAKKLSLAPKYIDQLIYGKIWGVDNNGNVNLLKLGVVDVKAGVSVEMGRGVKSVKKFTLVFPN